MPYTLTDFVYTIDGVNIHMADGDEAAALRAENSKNEDFNISVAAAWLDETLEYISSERDYPPACRTKALQLVDFFGLTA